MEQGAQSKLVDFFYPMYLVKDDYDINIAEEDYLERAYRIFREIGNVTSVRHSFEGVIGPDGTMQLPCNLEFIEAVSTGVHLYDSFDDTIFVSYYHTDQNYPQQNAEVRNIVADSSFGHRRRDSQGYPLGEFIPYTIVGSNEALQFKKESAGETVVVIYKGILTDAAGNPLINIKEAEAISSKLALRHFTKRAMMGDTAAVNMLPLLKGETARLMAAAKIPEYITQNFIDAMLTAKTRHDRKVFWSSYKTIQ
jgi:hypothetical protein